MSAEKRKLAAATTPLTLPPRRSGSRTRWRSIADKLADMRSLGHRNSDCCPVYTAFGTSRFVASKRLIAVAVSSIVATATSLYIAVGVIVAGLVAVATAVVEAGTRVLWAGLPMIP